MNKNYLYTIAVVFFIAVIFGTGFILSQQTQPSTDLPTTTQNETLRVDSKEEISDNNQTSKYIKYQEGQIEKYSDKKIVLFFYASWCPTCQPVDRSLSSLESEIPDDVVVIRVNYNDPQTDSDEKALADKFEITYQHTFVILDDGQEVARWNGGDFERILEELK